MGNSVKGLMNIANGLNHFIGDFDDPARVADLYHTRDARNIYLWGIFDLSNGEFTATRNPITHTDDKRCVRMGQRVVDGELRNVIDGIAVDNSVDYRGSKFVDDAYVAGLGYRADMKAAPADDKTLMEMAVELSREARNAKIAKGLTDSVANVIYFEP